MITMTQIMIVIDSPGAEGPKSMVNFFIAIIVSPVEERLPKKAARGQNDGMAKIFS